MRRTVRPSFLMPCRMMRANSPSEYAAPRLSGVMFGPWSDAEGPHLDRLAAPEVFPVAESRRASPEGVRRGDLPRARTAASVERAEVRRRDVVDLLHAGVELRALDVHEYAEDEPQQHDHKPHHLEHALENSHDPPMLLRESAHLHDRPCRRARLFEVDRREDRPVVVSLRRRRRPARLATALRPPRRRAR